MELFIERVEPEHHLSWRWHPAAIDPKVDYSSEPTTLVVFDLKETAAGTLITVVETGFDAVPPERRSSVFRMNTNGWDSQMKSIEKHVAAET